MEKVVVSLGSLVLVVEVVVEEAMFWIILWGSGRGRSRGCRMRWE